LSSEETVTKTKPAILQEVACEYVTYDGRIPPTRAVEDAVRRCSYKITGTWLSVGWRIASVTITPIAVADQATPMYLVTMIGEREQQETED
jgi:hypothetical protein